MNENSQEKKDTDVQYNAEQIQVLEGIEAIRTRPTMYIDDLGVGGLHHLVYEVVDNSIDEALAGYCDHITVKIHADESVTIIDNGRGIPVDFHEDQQKSALEVIMTTLHSGSKFDHSVYKVSGGLYGVGISVVNALAERLEVEVFRDGYVHSQSFERGKAVGPVKKLGKTNKRGTKTWFIPDSTIFDECIFSYGILAKRLRELSFLNSGIRISLSDERDGKSESFYNEQGIKTFVAHLNLNRRVIHNVIYFSNTKEEGTPNEIAVELAMQYHDGYNETIYTYANNIHTREGGTHLSGFKSALTRTLNIYSKKGTLLKGKNTPIGDDWREGLTAVLSVKVPNPQFGGQTKGKLVNQEVQSLVETILNEQLTIYLEENPQVAKGIIGKGLRLLVFAKPPKELEI